MVVILSCKMKEPVKFGMHGRLQILDGKGEVVFTKDNLIVDKALELTIDRLKDNSKSFLDYIAIGTGITAPASSDTALETEVFRKQVTTKNATLTTLEVEVLIDAGEANFTWREIGVFNDPTTGEMFNRIALNFVKSPLDSFTVKFTFTFSLV